MSVNRNRPHLLVLPEDDANRQIANGFQLGVDEKFSRQIQVLNVAGGWIKVQECFADHHVSAMRDCRPRLMARVIDCDDKKERIVAVQQKIPSDLADRVFVLGCLTQPEALKAVLGSYETIGLGLAADCRNDTDKIWANKLLLHNADEVRRLREQVRPILFA